MSQDEAANTIVDEVQFIKEGYDELVQQRRAAAEAATIANQKEDRLLQMLRQRYQGKLIEVTVVTETEEYFGQDGYEHTRSRSYLRGERLYIESIFISVRDSLTAATPIIYAIREEAHRLQQRGGRLSFRLLEARQLRIVEPSPLPSEEA